MDRSDQLLSVLRRLYSRHARPSTPVTTSSLASEGMALVGEMQAAFITFLYGQSLQACLSPARASEYIITIGLQSVETVSCTVRAL